LLIISKLRGGGGEVAERKVVVSSSVPRPSQCNFLVFEGNKEKRERSSCSFKRGRGEVARKRFPSKKGGERSHEESKFKGEENSNLIKERGRRDYIGGNWLRGQPIISEGRWGGATGKQNPLLVLRKGGGG